LETTPESLLGDFVQMISFDNEFYIRSLSDQKIYRFDGKGNFKNSIGEVGNGPGQYSSISSFQIGEDNTIDVLSNLGNQSRIYKYSLEGNFIEYEILKDRYFYDLITFNDKTYFSNGSNTMDDKDWRVFSREQGDNIEGILALGVNKSMTIQEQNFSIGNLNLFYHESFDPAIYKLTDEGFEEYLTIDFGKYNLKKEYFQEGDFYEKYDVMMKNGIGILRKFLQTPQTQYLNVVIQNENSAEFYHVLLNTNNSESIVFEAMDGRAPAFYFQDESLVLMAHPADLKEHIATNNTKNTPSYLFQKVKNLTTNDNPVVLKINLSELWKN
jgi:hypothetical protein